MLAVSLAAGATPAAAEAVVAVIAVDEG